MDIIDMEARATEAGESVGKAHHRLRDLIRDMYTQDNITSYSGPEHKAARKSFAQAAENAGTSKNSGMTLYARAYDSLIADGLPLEPRARKGAGGRKAQAAASESGVDDAASGDSDVSEAPLSNDEAIARARPFIAAESIRDFCEANGIRFDVAKDAALSYREAAQRRDNVPASAHPLIDDLMATILSLGKALEGALKARDALLESVGYEPIDYVSGSSADLAATEPAQAQKEPEDMTDEELLAELAEPATEPAKSRKPRKAGKPRKAKSAKGSRSPRGASPSEPVALAMA